jgi:hypothetical protein
MPMLAGISWKDAVKQVGCNPKQLEQVLNDHLNKGQLTEAFTV